MTETAELLANSQQACDAQCACVPPCQCLGSYDVEITLKTRLAGKKLKNVPIAVVGKKEQPTVSGANELVFPTEDIIAQGVIGADGTFKANDLKAEYLEVWAKYENSGEKLRREVIKLSLGRLNPTCKALETIGSGNKVINQVWKVQDVKGEPHDKNFNDEREIIIKPAEGSQTKIADTEGTADGSVTKCFIEKTGRAAADSTEIYDTEIVAMYAASADKDARLKLEITLVVDTFSLDVPYLNQNMGSVILFIYPGSLATNPPAGSVLYGFPTQTPTSIFGGGNSSKLYSDSSKTNEMIRKTLDDNGWPIDESEREYVYEQVKNFLPVTIQLPSFTFKTYIPGLNSQADKTSIRGLLGCYTTPTTSPMPPPHEHSTNCTEIYKLHLRAGADLCGPTSALMLMLYHGYPSDNVHRSRSELMLKSYELVTNKFMSWNGVVDYTAGGDKPWQTYSKLSEATAVMMTEQGQFAGLRTNLLANKDGVFLPSLRRGLPSVGHIQRHFIVIRGAVIDKTGTDVWKICNDPYGTLAKSDSNYASTTGYNTAEINLYGSGDDESRTKGRHVYYKSGETHRDKPGTKSGTTVQIIGIFYIENNISIEDKLIHGA